MQVKKIFDYFKKFEHVMLEHQKITRKIFSYFYCFKLQGAIEHYSEIILQGSCTQL